jgi:DNA polymerase-1
VTVTDLPFEQIWFADFEFIAESGELPDVICLCAREFRSGQIVRLWRDEKTDQLELPPYLLNDKALFVCFVANAECLCHLTLGWPLPRNVLDLYPIFRAYLNGRNPPAEGRGLIGALGHFGLSTTGGRRKDAMRTRILQGRPFTPEEQVQILAYCMSDVDALMQLLPKLLPQPADLDIALHWGEFAAVSAAMEHRGIPIDMEICRQLQDKATWSFARDSLVPAIDAQYGVYVRGKDGDWHFNVARFEDYLAGAGIDWPRDESGKLNLQRKTFDSMAKAQPELEPLRQLRHARDKMRRIKLAVGSDGRNRTVLWPFASKTSRSQPKAAQWIFSPSTWLRSLIKPAPGRAIAYIDWSSMEFQIAGALSKCQPMLELYASGSPYISFAKRFDEAPPEATKKTHAQVHERYKVACLGAQYGMQTDTLAQRLGLSTFVAGEMLGQHRGLFNQYWQWSEDWTARALDTGVMSTAFGWTCRTGTTEFNARSIGNWPVQSTGADILRLACVWAHRRGIQLCGSVHDAVVIEAAADRIEADVALMQEIMRRASRVVLAGPELRTDATIVRYPDRYSDSRGAKIWQDVLGLLARYQRQNMEDGRAEAIA